MSFLTFPLLTILTSVCGADIVETDTEIKARVKKIRTVYNCTLDKTNPIIKEVGTGKNDS